MHDLAFVGGTFAFGFGWQLEDIVESRVTSDAPVSSLESQKGSADRKKYDLSGERLFCNYPATIPATIPASPFVTGVGTTIF